MDVYEAIIRRRTIRWFKDTTIPHDVLLKCVDAARLAPAARNAQVSEFVLVDDDKLLQKVFETVGAWGGQPRPKAGPPPGHRPKAYVIGIINTNRKKDYGISTSAAGCDMGMASENLILAAFEQGISACPIMSFVEGELRQALNVPVQYEINVVLALGYPDETSVTEAAVGDATKYYLDDRGVRRVPKRKMEDVLHRNRF